jgi:hypothetical protein
MAEIKTKVNDSDVEAFINKVPDETKRQDSFKLLEIFKNVTGLEPKMWGSSMIGYDQYHYKSERSRQEGDWPMVAFSPRKQNLTIYCMPGFANVQDLLTKLGKHKTSVGCLYINKLADVDTGVLEQIVSRTYKEMQSQYPK